MMKVAVTGASGRMGSKIIKTILQQEDMDLVAAIEAPYTSLEGKDIGEVIGAGPVGVKVTGAENLQDALLESQAEVLVDFTISSAALETIQIAAKCDLNLVVGTTGFSEEEFFSIKSAIEKNKVKAVISPNMAVGVNVFFKILEDLALILSDYDVEIIEAHHKYKQDSPSGTANKALEIISQVLNRNSEEVGVYGRKGILGKRSHEEIGVHAVRGGDIVGEHMVLFAGEGERIEIVHRAHSRQAFVSGVIKALRFLKDAEPGKINDMSDILGFE